MEIFNKGDVDSVFSLNFDLKNIHEIIKEKVENDPIPNYFYNRKDYDTIYSVSDIHADYRTLLWYLHKFGIIKLPIDYDVEELLESDNQDFIYNSDFIASVEWTAGERTLLVICGDIVDGKRTSEVNDPKGVFEILLHMFLRNLKIKAKEKKSDVLLVCGNHDFLNSEPLYEKYTHKSAKHIYNESLYNRYKLLNEFYKNFTLFFGISNSKLELKNIIEPENIKDFEILFLHGGIHYSKDNTTTY